MKKTLSNLTVIFRSLAMLLALTIASSHAADGPKQTLLEKSLSPLDQALASWRQGNQQAAVDQFLKIDWKTSPAFSATSPLAAAEKDLPKMSAPAREKLIADAMTSLKDLKQLASAVKQKATLTSKSNPVLARSYLANLQECATALDKPEALKIVQLMAQALRKLATAETKTP